MTSESDHGLAALEEIYEASTSGTDETPTVTLELLHACYRISYKQRYDSGRESELRQEIRRAVESFVDDTAKTEDPQ